SGEITAGRGAGRGVRAGGSGCAMAKEARAMKERMNLITPDILSHNQTRWCEAHFAPPDILADMTRRTFARQALTAATAARFVQAEQPWIDLFDGHSLTN